ncbi:hypothetical protein HMPREF2738_02933 [Clostridiales bacterium KLE1615]|nr:hypothetical protein HMPREF2738_02933 [Clostridiales bacterium KLE1615]
MRKKVIDKIKSGIIIILYRTIRNRTILRSGKGRLYGKGKVDML